MGQSTGEIFLYVTDMDQSMVDINENDKAAFSISEAQNGLCAYRQLDPEDPRCARLVLMGSVAPVDKEPGVSFIATRKVYVLSFQRAYFQQKEAEVSLLV